LGRESPTTTYQYVEADLTVKEKAFAKLEEPNVKVARYRAPDKLIDFLKNLKLSRGQKRGCHLFQNLRNRSRS
jgi:hypothetical protein